MTIAATRVPLCGLHAVDRLPDAFHALDRLPESILALPRRSMHHDDRVALEEGKSEGIRHLVALLLQSGLLEVVQVSVETIGRHQVVVGAHLGHVAPIDHADHVGVPYSGQTMGYGDTRSALHGLVQSRLHDLHAENIG